MNVCTWPCDLRLLVLARAYMHLYVFGMPDAGFVRTKITALEMALFAMVFFFTADSTCYVTLPCVFVYSFGVSEYISMIKSR